MPSDFEKEKFLLMCRAFGLPTPTPEHRFHPTRKWRFDWYFGGPRKIALEVEGAVWTGGRHTRGKGFLGDVEKYNEAAILGFTILRCTPGQVKSGEAFTIVKRAMEGSEA